MKKREKFPRVCRDCKCRLIQGKVSEAQRKLFPDAKWLKVTASKPVMACKNALDEDKKHKCDLALCSKCYAKKVVAITERSERAKMNSRESNQKRSPLLETPRKRKREDDGTPPPTAPRRLTPELDRMVNPADMAAGRPKPKKRTAKRRS